jgi:chromosome segregation ATPase
VTPVEAASVVRFGRTGGDWVTQLRHLAAGLVLAQEVERLEGECDGLRRWKSEAIAVLTELDASWEAAGRPGRLGQSKARSLGAEVTRSQRECDELRAELDRVNAELHEQYEAVAAMVETFAEARDALQQAMGTP